MALKKAPAAAKSAAKSPKAAAPAKAAAPQATVTLKHLAAQILRTLHTPISKFLGTPSRKTMLKHQSRQVSQDRNAPHLGVPPQPT